MNTNTKIKSFLLIIVVVFISAVVNAAEGYSEINNALFDSPHMKNIKSPGKILYFFKSITDNQILEDKISITITNIRKEGHSDQAYSFLSGEKKKSYPSRNNVVGNGVFMYFLEKDVHDLEKKTGGSWRHFQRRIRWAMAAGADQKEIGINYNNISIKAIQYTIQPYSNDKDTKRYGTYANKYYQFTLSKDIPGMIYKVRTFVPKTERGKEGNGPIEDVSITFKQFQPAKIQANKN